MTMTARLTLAHISDIHLGPITGFTPRYWNIKRGLGFVNWQRRRRFVHATSIADLIAADALAQAPDHIAVTGDLVNIGLPAEYAAARSWLERLGSPAFVSVVPGNHDIYTGRLHGASCLESWGDYMQSDAWGAGLVNRADRRFPYVRRIGGAALIGLNSAVRTRPFFASGRLGTDQLDPLADILDRTRDEGLMRIVLLHHPPLPGQAPLRRALEDASALQKVLTSHGADLVLHGHNHTGTLVWQASSGRAVPIVGVASASATRAHHDEPTARYNLLTLTVEGDGVAIECVTRGLAPDGQSITEVARQRLTSVEPEAGLAPRLSTTASE